MRRTRKAFGVAAAVLFAVGCAPDTVVQPVDFLKQVSFTRGGGGGSAIDQSQPVGDATAPTVAIGGASGQIIAQVFTSGVTGKMRELEIPLGGCGGGRLLLEIRNASGGLPGATVLASEGFDVSSLPAVVGAFFTLSLRPSPDLVAGTQYAFVLSNPTGSCGILSGPVGDPYAGGNAYYNNPSGGWINLSNGTGREDLPFNTYMH